MAMPTPSDSGDGVSQTQASQPAESINCCSNVPNSLEFDIPADTKIGTYSLQDDSFSRSVVNSATCAAVSARGLIDVIALSWYSLTSRWYVFCDFQRRIVNIAVSTAQPTIAKELNQQDWLEHVSEALFGAAKIGPLDFVRKLIRESELEGPLFPLARAIDYLLTGDEALIEKLSPETRGIVVEVIATLGETHTRAMPPTRKKRQVTKEKISKRIVSQRHRKPTKQKRSKKG